MHVGAEVPRMVPQRLDGAAEHLHDDHGGVVVRCHSFFSRMIPERAWHTDGPLPLTLFMFNSTPEIPVTACRPGLARGTIARLHRSEPRTDRNNSIL